MNRFSAFHLNNEFHESPNLSKASQNYSGLMHCHWKMTSTQKTVHESIFRSQHLYLELVLRPCLGLRKFCIEFLCRKIKIPPSMLLMR